MKAEDVTAILEQALQASGCDQATLIQRPRPLSDNGSSYITDDLAKLSQGQGYGPCSRRPTPPSNLGHDRTLAPDYEEPGVAA
jgi:putative transposase